MSLSTRNKASLEKSNLRYYWAEADHVTPFSSLLARQVEDIENDKKKTDKYRYGDRTTQI